MRIELDLTNEINKAIEKEVVNQLDKGGLMRFIREVIRTEFKNSGTRKQLNRQEGEIRYLKEQLNKLGEKK